MQIFQSIQAVQQEVSVFHHLIISSIAVHAFYSTQWHYSFFLNFAFLCENKTNPCPLERYCLRQCVTKHKSVKGTVSQKCNVVQQWQIRRRKTKYFGGYLRFYRHLKFLPQKIPRIFSDFVTVYEHTYSMCFWEDKKKLKIPFYLAYNSVHPAVSICVVCEHYTAYYLI